MPRPTTNSSEGAQRPEKFAAAAGTVLGNLRAALGTLVESLPGPVRGAADVQRVLRLDWALSWQLFRVGSVPDPIEAGPDVPRPIPMAKALRAAAESGVAPEIVARVQHAYADFQRLVDQHAGDRGSFDSMARALRPGLAHIHLKDRRGAFRNLSSIWGIQTDVRYHCGISHRGVSIDKQDHIVLTGYIGLRRLRAGAPISIGGRAKLQSGPGQEPIESTALGVLEEFSSKPLPPLRIKPLDAGMVETLLELDDVGLFSAISHFMRREIRDTPSSPDDQWGSSVVSRLPTQAMVLDLLVPAGWSDPNSRHIATYGNLHQQDRGWARDEADRLPVDESIIHLGQDLERLRTPLVPRCVEMVTSVLRDAGWDQTRFDIYRCTVQYPILFACVATMVAGKPLAN